MPVILPNLSGKGVQFFTLPLGNLPVVIMVGPRGNEKQSTLRASLKLPADRFLVWREAVFQEKNHGVTSLKCRAHDLLLSWADARRDKDRPFTRYRQEALAFSVYFSLGESS